MNHVGYSLINLNTIEEVCFWGDTFSQTEDIPKFIILPNQDHVHCPEDGGVYGDFKVVKRFIKEDPNEGVDITTDSVVIRRASVITPPKYITKAQLVTGMMNSGMITAEEAISCSQNNTVPSTLHEFISRDYPDDLNHAIINWSLQNEVGRGTLTTKYICECFSLSPVELDNYFVEWFNL